MWALHSAESQYSKTDVHLSHEFKDWEIKGIEGCYSPQLLILWSHQLTFKVTVLHQNMFQPIENVIDKASDNNNENNFIIKPVHAVYD